MFVLKALVVAAAIIAVNSRALENLAVNISDGNHEVAVDSNAGSYLGNGGLYSASRQKRQFTAHNTGNVEFKGANNFAPIENSQVHMASGREESRGLILDVINSVTGIVGVRL